ncbi:MAG: hypothetical protein GY931_19575 [Maribacter sp.]|nr:hypothetical protein [Maribacter sp.]
MLAEPMMRERQVTFDLSRGAIWTLLLPRGHLWGAASVIKTCGVHNFVNLFAKVEMTDCNKNVTTWETNNANRFFEDCGLVKALVYICILPSRTLVISLNEISFIHLFLNSC